MVWAGFGFELARYFKRKYFKENISKKTTTIYFNFNEYIYAQFYTKKDTINIKHIIVHYLSIIVLKHKLFSFTLCSGLFQVEFIGYSHVPD